MSSVNKVIIVGNLGRDPEVRTFPGGGGRVASLSVATSERWTDKSTGERKEKTEWHRVSILNERLVEIIQKYLHKGSKVYIEGALQTRKWTDKDGAERYTTEIVLKQYRGELVMLGDDRGSSEPSAGRRAEPRQTTSKVTQKDFSFDDDIPF